jgi:nicotinamidase/pyrazinamidase
VKALLLVDIQNDFLPGGALAVPNGDAVIAVANRLMPAYPLVVATQDWHPAGHQSFASAHPGRSVGDVVDLHGMQQILWPDHCVQDTAGAELCGDLDRRRIAAVVRKGTDPQFDSYSGFHDNGRQKSTGLARLLRDRGATGVDVMGLATDYCVKFTVLDALAEGFDTSLLVTGCQGVDRQPGDCARAIEAMQKAGARMVGQTPVAARPRFDAST